MSYMIGDYVTYCNTCETYKCCSVTFNDTSKCCDIEGNCYE